MDAMKSSSAAPSLRGSIGATYRVQNVYYFHVSISPIQSGCLVEFATRARSAAGDRISRNDRRPGREKGPVLKRVGRPGKGEGEWRTPIHLPMNVRDLKASAHTERSRNRGVCCRVRELDAGNPQVPVRRAGSGNGTSVTTLFQKSKFE